MITWITIASTVSMVNSYYSSGIFIQLLTYSSIFYRRGDATAPYINFQAVRSTLSSISPSLRLTSRILGRLKLLVLLVDIPFRNQHKDDDKTTAGNDSTSTSLVVRLLVTKEEVGCEPVRHRGDTVGVCDEGRTLCTRARNNGGFPGDLKLLLLA